MEATILCNTPRCGAEVDEHYYCDSHMREKLDEAYERGKKEGHDEGYEEAKDEFSTTN